MKIWPQGLGGRVTRKTPVLPPRLEIKCAGAAGRPERERGVENVEMKDK